MFTSKEITLDIFPLLTMESIPLMQRIRITTSNKGNLYLLGKIAYLVAIKYKDRDDIITNSQLISCSLRSFIYINDNKVFKKKVLFCITNSN